MMPRWQRAWLVATCALIGAAFAYAASDWARWPHLTYLPVSGEWTLHPPASAIAITYLGSVAWGLGGAVVGALCGAGLCAIVRRPVGERVQLLLGAWAITALLLAGGYYTWTLWPW